MKMKVLFLLYSYHTMNFFKRMAKQLEQEGHEIKILAIEPLPYGAKEDGFKTYRVDWHQFDWEMINRYNPDRVVIFNGYFSIFYAASMLLRKRYNTFFAEVGWLPQNDFIYIDEDILGNSRIAKEPTDIITPLRPSHKAILEDLRKKYSPSEELSITLPSKYILIPLQLEQDTSIIYSSPYFKDMISFVAFVCQSARNVPIVIKVHPKLNFEGSGIDVEEYVKSFYRLGVTQVILDPKVTMNDLASRAHLIVGINSTSLIEAMVHGKNIIQFGNSVLETNGSGPLTKAESFIKGSLTLKEHFEKISSEASSLVRDVMDRRLLHLYANQIPFRDPPKWATDKIIKYDTKPRGMRNL